MRGSVVLCTANMIGGTVIETIILPRKVWINCREPESNCECAIYVRLNEDSRKVRPGDTVWWQGAYAMWTSHRSLGGLMQDEHSRVGVDRCFMRLGCSGVPRPQR